jgi:hypothetical protein
MMFREIAAFAAFDPYLAAVSGMVPPLTFLAREAGRLARRCGGSVAMLRQRRTVRPIS